ncbi:hypothetical protein ABZ912_38385 [Nonomuraea angiospora]|uniref:hypothetical protein n=1 Tax=Nonomuraea angiospora TaxID=46172 RepID=UPI0033C43B55
MLEGLSKGLADRVAERWTRVVILPAALFWLGGGLVWLLGSGRDVEAAVQAVTKQVSTWMVAAFLVVVLLSGLLARRLVDPVLGLLTGRWPRWFDFLARPAARRWSRRIAAREARWQVLAGQARGWSEDRELAALDTWLRGMPADPARCLPSRLGNVLAAAERWPTEKYGLEASHCWSRLWLVIPEEARKELIGARERLDGQLTAWMWGVAFFVWTPWAWWAAPVGVVAAVVAYAGAVRYAGALGDLQESAFDLYRGALYTHLRWPLPEDAEAERAAGRLLTAYLWRGSHDRIPLRPE